MELLAIRLMNHEKRQAPDDEVQVISPPYYNRYQRQFPSETHFRSSTRWKQDNLDASLVWDKKRKILRCLECTYKCKPHAYLRVMHALHGSERCPATVPWDMEEELRLMFQALMSHTHMLKTRQSYERSAPAYLGSRKIVELMTRSGLRGTFTGVECFVCGEKYGKMFVYNHKKHLQGKCIYPKLSNLCHKLKMDHLVKEFIEFCDLFLIASKIPRVPEYYFSTYDEMINDMRGRIRFVLELSRTFLKERERVIKTEEADGEADRCPVCWAKKKNVALGCGHIFCNECVDRLASCCFCLEPITSKLHVFI